MKHSNSTVIFRMTMMGLLGFAALLATGRPAANADVYESLCPFLIPLYPGKIVFNAEQRSGGMM